MNVVYALTRNFYHKLIPSIRSLVEHNPKVKIYILAEDDEIPGLPVKATIVNISGEHQFDNSVNIRNHFGGYINLLKVYYPKYFPRVNKIIHLDVDTIICDSLEPFWSIDLTGKWVAAVPEYKARHSQLKLYGDTYYNAGIMVLNLQQMRKDKIMDEMAQFLINVPQPFADQDAWNKFGIEQDKIVAAPVRFNECSSCGRTDNPAIVHYCAIADWWTRKKMFRRWYLDKYKGDRKVISVIIPFYNSAEWLGRCVDSLKQEGDFEFIFVDDKSTDGGADIIKGVKDERFKLITNEHKKGVSGARNTGIEHATGDWITFLDADDEFLPNAYDTLTMVIRADERANIHQMNHLRYYHKIDKTALKYINDRGSYSTDNLPEYWFAVWNKVYKRELIKDLRFNEKLQYGEDLMFVLDCLAADDYIHHASRRVVSLKRNFDNKESLSRNKKEADVWKYIRELENYLKKQENPKIRKTICTVLSDDWKSKRVLELIGHV